jgi:hypothetical protein
VKVPLAEAVLLEVCVQNCTAHRCDVRLSVSCVDEAARDCLSSSSSRSSGGGGGGGGGAVLHAGAVREVALVVPPFVTACHPFALCVMQPGRYSVGAAAALVFPTEEEEEEDTLARSVPAENPPPPPLLRVLPICLEVA